MVSHKNSMSNSVAAEKPENRRRINAERSAYFARREAAKVLRVVLQGDARRRAVGSIKSLVYSPSVKNKKGTFALVCETLKRKLALIFSESLCIPDTQRLIFFLVFSFSDLFIIKEVLKAASILNSKWKVYKQITTFCLCN